MQKKETQDYSEEKLGKTYGKVFNTTTNKALHALSSKGYFNHLENLVNEGKEANLYLASDYSGNPVAVKIYKVLVADFKNMRPYLIGDIRFKQVKQTRHGLIKQWAQKEYKNLTLLQKCEVAAPYPIAVKDNVLVMEFIGKGDVASKRLKDIKPENLQKLFDTVAEYMARMMYLGELIHADLSEYNILMQKDKPVIIDVGQSILTSHPKAEEFFFRDAKIMQKYFTSNGLEQDLVEKIKSFKKKFKKSKY